MTRSAVTISSRGLAVEHPTGADYGVIDGIVVDLATARFPPGNGSALLALQ